MRSTFTILALLLLGVFWVARPWALTRMMQCKGDVIYFLLIYFFTCDPCLCKWYVCRHSQPTWLCHFGSSYWSSDHLVFEKPFSLCPCQDSQWWKRVQLRWLQAKTLIPLDPMNLLPWPALSRKWSQKEWGRRKWGGLIHAQWQCTGSGPGREYCTHGTGHGRYGSVSSLLHGGSVNKRPPAAWRHMVVWTKMKLPEGCWIRFCESTDWIAGLSRCCNKGDGCHCWIECCSHPAVLKCGELNLLKFLLQAGGFLYKACGDTAAFDSWLSEHRIWQKTTCKLCKKLWIFCLMFVILSRDLHFLLVEEPKARQRGKGRVQ